MGSENARPKNTRPGITRNMNMKDHYMFCI